MSTPHTLTRTEWNTFHDQYMNGNAATCTQCAASGAVLRPLDRIVRFACGHEMAIPDNTG